MQTVEGLCLNERQQLAAENFTDSILLLAGAGTGKTNSLACRVANLLAAGIAAPEEILCLTFTNRACKEMSERIGGMAGDGAQSVTVRTIHSFCAWLLRTTPGAFSDLRQDFAVCDADDANELLREVVFEVTQRQIGDLPARILQGFVGMVKERMLGQPDEDCTTAAGRLFVERRKDLERLCVDGSRQFDAKFYAFLAKYGASFVRFYNLKLLSNNLLDFSDLLLRADALLRDPRAAVVWENRYRYVHVDEAQDMSLAEWELVRRLCGGAKVLLCGDFNQTIYQWRGSDPTALIARFKAEFSPLELEFTHNYRSSAGLLAAAKNVLHRAFGLGAPVEAQYDGALVKRDFETTAEEADWIYRELAGLHLKDYSRAAIIVRNNRICADLCDLLRASRAADQSEEPVRFMLADELRLFKRAEIKDLLACISLIANPRDGESLGRVLKRLVKGIGAATVEAIVTGYRAGLGVALADFADPRTRFHGDFFEPLLAALEAGRVVVYDVESTGTDVYTDEIVQYAAVRLAPDGTVAARLERFLRPTRPVGGSEKVHGFSDAFLAERGGDPEKALSELLEFTDGCVVVGHNVAFDVTITGGNLLRAGIDRPFCTLWYDTLDLSRRFLKNLENHKLSTVAEVLDAAHKPSHDAMDDILATADVLLALTAQHLTPRTTERRAFYAKFLPRFTDFSALLDRLREQSKTLHAPALARLLCKSFGVEELHKTAPERLANLSLFFDFADEFTDDTQPLGRQLAGLLELSALSSSELDRMSKGANKVAVITAHQSKGCEFDYVFLPALQEGVFPSAQAVRSGELEEEKRVFYVSITRAKQKLFLSWAKYGSTQYAAKPSRFWEFL